MRWQRRLDFLIAHLTGKACSRLETTTHAILRLAVHELTFQRLPAHAISEHVNLAKALVRPAAGNLVNGESFTHRLLLLVGSVSTVFCFANGDEKQGK